MADNNNDEEKWYEKVCRWAVGILIVPGLIYAWFIEPVIDFKNRKNISDGWALIIVVGGLLWLIIFILYDKFKKKK